jgi:two-component system nitrogen regulation response regulator NtrX
MRIDLALWNQQQRACLAENILIVDDEENLYCSSRILTRQGYQVVTAQNSYDARTLVETRMFQLAILDIKMFPLDGVFLLGEIKSRFLPQK